MRKMCTLLSVQFTIVEKNSYPIKTENKDTRAN